MFVPDETTKDEANSATTKNLRWEPQIPHKQHPISFLKRMEGFNAGSPFPTKESENKWTFLRQLDIFPKFDEEITIRNSISGIGTLTTSHLLMLQFLLASHLSLLSCL